MSLVEIGHEMISTAILSQPLIQIEQLSVIGTSIMAEISEYLDSVSNRSPIFGLGLLFFQKIYQIWNCAVRLLQAVWIPILQWLVTSLFGLGTGW